MTTIRYSTFPRTAPPPPFVDEVVGAFRLHEKAIATQVIDKHLKSDVVLGLVAPELVAMGFEIESGKAKSQKIARPVFFGENGIPALRFEVDGYHPKWRCGLEVEAIRAIRGGAFYRDLIQAMVMVQLDFLIVALPNITTWGKGGKSRSYEEAVRTADALYGHSRLHMPFGLILIGY